MDNPAVIIVAFVVLALGFRLIAGNMDGDRVRKYIEERGGTLISSGWKPFGKGWFGEKSDRIYAVRYRDRDGNEHEASCKTSMFSGVYFTEDRIVSYGEQAARSPAEPSADSSRVAKLEAENHELREEIDRLRKRLS